MILRRLHTNTQANRLHCSYFALEKNGGQLERSNYIKSCVFMIDTLINSHFRLNSNGVSALTICIQIKRSAEFIDVP